MKKNQKHGKKIIPNFFGILIAISILFGWIIKSSQKANSHKGKPIIEKADVKVERMELTETNGEDFTWSLKAEQAEVFEKKACANLKNITLTYSVKGGGEIVLTGDRGEIDLTEKNIFLEGNVVAVFNQFHLKTESLNWFREKRVLSSEKPVLIKRQDIEISGKKMIADIELAKITLLDKVVTTIY